MTTRKMHTNLKRKVEDGTYNIGEPIVPRKFRKISKTGEEFEVKIMGRKIPLKEIRQEMLSQNKERNIVRAPYMNGDRDALIEKLKVIGEFRPEHCTFPTTYQDIGEGKATEIFDVLGG